MAERDSATAFPLDRARVPTAVSRTLSGSERVNEFSRQRVLGAGHSLFDHVPEREAPGLAQKGPTALGSELRHAADALLLAGCSTRPLDVPFELPLGCPTWVVSLSAKPTSSAPLGGPEKEY